MSAVRAVPLSGCLLYIYEAVEDFTEADLSRALPLISAAYLQRVAALRDPLQRRLGVIGRLLLRHATGATPSEPMGSERGKPFFLSPQMPRFSISHCDVAVACAVAPRQVGVDVEAYSAFHPELPPQVLSDAEQTYAAGSPERFMELWTRKESLLKLRATGLDLTMEQLRELLGGGGTEQIATFSRPHPGYACSVSLMAGCALPAAPVTVNKEALYTDPYAN